MSKTNVTEETKNKKKADKDRLSNNLRDNLKRRKESSKNSDDK